MIKSALLLLTINRNDKSGFITFDIAQGSDQVLAITKRRGETFMSIILVEKGSGLVYKKAVFTFNETNVNMFSKSERIREFTSE